MTEIPTGMRPVAVRRVPDVLERAAEGSVSPRHRGDHEYQPPAPCSGLLEASRVRRLHDSSAAALSGRSHEAEWRREARRDSGRGSHSAGQHRSRAPLRDLRFNRGSREQLSPASAASGKSDLRERTAAPSVLPSVRTRSRKSGTGERYEDSNVALHHCIAALLAVLLAVPLSAVASAQEVPDAPQPQTTAPAPAPPAQNAAEVASLPDSPVPQNDPASAATATR